MEKTEIQTPLKKRNWFLAFFNDKSKTKLTWWNRNYFYIGTLFMVALIVGLFGILGSGWCFKLYDNKVTWESFSFINFLGIVFNSLDHASWSHVLGNAIGLFVVGLYLERKYGTFKFLGLCIVLLFTVGALTSHVYGSTSHHGFSCVNYALYGFLLTDYLFSFRNGKRNVTNIVLGALVLIYVYVFSMCWGGKSFIDVEAYPKNLITNSGHWPPFFWSLIVGCLWQIGMIFGEKTNSKGETIAKEKHKKKKKEKVLKEETQEPVAVEKKKTKKTKTKKEKKPKVVKKKQAKKVKQEKLEEEKAPTPVKKIEEPKVEEKVTVKVEEEKPQVSLPEKKLTALPEDMKVVQTKRTYRKKKKPAASTKPALVIRPVVSKQSAKKTDKK